MNLAANNTGVPGTPPGQDVPSLKDGLRLSPLVLPTPDNALLLWKRGVGLPPSVRRPGSLTADFIKSRTGITVIWSAGFIANKVELLAGDLQSELQTDADLWVRLYRRNRLTAPGCIAGSFSALIWDGERQELVAVSDRMGVHAIYYTVRGNLVIVAPCLELILDVLPTIPRLNTNAVVRHINGLLAPPPKETFYQGIHIVEPGAILTVSDAHLSTQRYWQVEVQPTLKLPNDQAYGDALRECLFRVVREYVPDGRLGVMLSGGMDSTSIAAAIQATVPSADLLAFSWSAPDVPEADETRLSTAVSDRLRIPSFTIRFDRHWPLRSNDAIQTSRSSPIYNMYKDVWDTSFARMQQEGCRVAFTGFSGDHLFGEAIYAYADLLLTMRWKNLARELKTAIAETNRSLAHAIRYLLLGPLARAYIPSRHIYPISPAPWLNERLRCLKPTQLRNPSNRWRMLPGRLQRLALLREPTIGPTTGFTTRQAASHGIDLRHPLLDHRLIEFAASLPTTQTARALQTKTILRKAMRGYLPDEVLDYRRAIYPAKVGHLGLRDRESAKVRQLVTNMRAAEMGFVDEGKLRTCYEAYLRRKHHSMSFWNTLTLEDWLRRYF